MSFLSPYSDTNRPYSVRRTRRSRAMQVSFRDPDSKPPLESLLLQDDEDRALFMFRDEGRDTKEIAWRMEATEAAVANGIANARDREMHNGRCR